MARIVKILILAAILLAAYHFVIGRGPAPQPEDKPVGVRPTAPLEIYAHEVVTSAIPGLTLSMHHGSAGESKYWLYYRPIPDVDIESLSSALATQGLSVEKVVPGSDWFVSASGEYNGTSVTIQIYPAPEKNALAVLVFIPKTS